MNEKKKGSLLIIVAYIIWGILPFYWQQLNEVSSLEIISYRIIMSFLICISILFFQKKLSIYSKLLNYKFLIRFIIISLLLFLNWSTFIYAVSNNLIIDAGMGYYLTPIVSVLLGIIFLKEKLDNMQKIAFLIALLGIAYYIISVGVFPYLALTLAFAFSIYGLLKKKTKISGLNSMAIETAILMPLALIILFIVSNQNTIALFSIGGNKVILILLAGVVTLIPLILFAEATKRITLIRVGFLQFIGPTLMLITGVFMGEVFTLNQIITFVFIWISLIVYSVSIVRRNKNDRKNNKGNTAIKK